MTNPRRTTILHCHASTLIGLVIDCDDMRQCYVVGCGPDEIEHSDPRCPACARRMVQRLNAEHVATIPTCALWEGARPHGRHCLASYHIDDGGWAEGCPMRCTDCGRVLVPGGGSDDAMIDLAIRDGYLDELASVEDDVDHDDSRRRQWARAVLRAMVRRHPCPVYIPEGLPR